LKRLFQNAREYLHSIHHDEIHLRGIIEISNRCGCRCNFCGLNAGNSALKRYRMSAGEIIRAAREGVGRGVKTIVLQSGEDNWLDVAMLEFVIRAVKETGAAVTCSFGEMPFGHYERLRAAGADRYLLKFETSNASLFESATGGKSLKKRLEKITELKSLGFQTGTGNLIGLPGQTPDDIINDIFLVRDIGADMGAFSPFIPHANTALGSQKPGDLSLTLFTMLIARNMMPRLHIPATTALATLARGEGFSSIRCGRNENASSGRCRHASGRLLGIMCGANVIMPDVTPEKYRKDYEIYPGRAGRCESPEESIEKCAMLVKLAGLKVSSGRGDGLAGGESFRQYY